MAKSCKLHNSLLSNLLWQNIWCFLIKWWSWIARLMEFPETINICSIHGFGKEWISWTHLNFSLFARQYSSWCCYIICFEQLFSKIDISFRKWRKEDNVVAYLDLTIKPQKLRWNCRWCQYLKWEFTAKGSNNFKSFNNF